MLPDDLPMELRCMDVKVSLGVCLSWPKRSSGKYDERFAILVTHGRIIDFIHTIPLLVAVGDELLVVMGYLCMLLHVDRLPALRSFPYSTYLFVVTSLDVTGPKFDQRHCPPVVSLLVAEIDKRR